MFTKANNNGGIGEDTRMNKVKIEFDLETLDEDELFEIFEKKCIEAEQDYIRKKKLKGEEINPRKLNDAMTSSDGLKSVVSCNGSMPRKPFNINHFGSFNTKGLLYGSLNGISPDISTTSLSGGGHHDCTTIQTFQSVDL
jgi:hypothetical protein